MNLTSPPTVTTPLTAQGTILGTFQYMAPEQLEGEDADPRTDIWAFGCVLYEMLTGKKAFAGRTHASLISSIMSAHPPAVAETIAQAPPVLDHVVRTCLAKDPAERFQTAHDLLLQLRWIAGGSAAGQPAVAAPARRGLKPLAFSGLVAGVAVVSAAGTWLLTRPAPRAPVPATRALIELPPKIGYGIFATGNLALSDGSRLVYVGVTEEGGANLYVRDLERFEPASVLSGSADAVMPFFSRDGAWLGFFAGGKLKRMAISGGAPTVICEMTAALGAAWAPDDTIVFTDALKGVLMRVPAGGGTPTALTTLENGETGHRWPTVLPDGAVIFAANRSSNWSESQLVVLPAGGGPRRTILEGGTFPRYLDSGYLTFVRNGELLVLPFDARTLKAVGEPRQIAQSISSNEFDGRAQVAIAARGGMMAYVVSPASSVARSLVWVNRDGTTQPLPLERRAYEHPRISPDGRRVALAVREANTDVWVIDIERKTLSRFTFDPAEDESPVWTPDGTRITYAASRTGKPRTTFWKAADSSGVEEALFVSKTHQHVSGWSPDGKTLVSEEVDGTFGLYVGSIGDQAVKPYLQTAFIEVGAQISPDGKWIAYASNESGPPQVFVQAFPGPGSRIQISSTSGSEPRWAPNGRELFYRSGDRMMAVPIEYTPALRPGAPATLFEGQYARIGWGSANYDVTPDGRRFLMIKGDEQALPTQIRLVVNPLDELRRIAPHK